MKVACSVWEQGKIREDSTYAYVGTHPMPPLIECCSQCYDPLGIVPLWRYVNAHLTVEAFQKPHQSFNAVVGKLGGFKPGNFRLLHTK